MNNWQQERSAVLMWWPQWLAGRKPDGHMFVDSLEESAWGARQDSEWNVWVGQVGKIWPNSAHFSNPVFPLRFLGALPTGGAERDRAEQDGSEQTQLTLADEFAPIEPMNADGIDVHFGPTLGQALYEKMQHPHQPLRLYAGTGVVGRISYPADIFTAAQRLLHEFMLAEVVVSRGSSPGWVKKQLMDAHIGLANMAMALGIPHHSIGRGKLKLWLHEQSNQRGASTSQTDHLEIHNRGGNVAQTWALWRLAQVPTRMMNTTDLIGVWRRSWEKSPRQAFEHQEQFLHKSQQSFKSLVDSVPVTSEMGQRAFRRYRAACKWMDDVQRGLTREQLQQSWNKVKIGNRIAWSNDQSLGAKRLIQNWTWEERLIEAAFWKAPQWHVPAWVQRHQALSHDAWPRHLDALQENDCWGLWAVGFEAQLRQRLGYDGWIAHNHICHPHRQEAEDFSLFFEEHLRLIIQDIR